MRGPMKAILLIYLMLIVNNSNLAFASGLPQEVREFAEQQSCSEITGFYERPGMVEPSFQYGYIQNIDKSESIIFWCQSNKDENIYKLIVNIKNKSDIGCSEVIYKTKNFPGGLSISTKKDLDLAGYRQVGRSVGKKTCGVEGVVIDSFYDGVGYTFLYHDGVWMYKMWD
jgi:hypothetical protein